VSWLLGNIAELVVRALNALIAGLAAALALVLAVLPDMPDLPTPSVALVRAESWVSWFFPVGTLLDVLAFVVTVWLLWQAVAIALRWAKASAED
jgi:hypothetical protein